jgi:hypothetical protein
MAEKRDFHGFAQFNEVGRWRFYVTGFDGTFSGQPGFCSVLRSDGSIERDIRIDAKNRILIAGKWHSSRHWFH